MSKPLFVLIVEDALELATIYQEILEMDGFDVEVISDGAVAMTRLGDLVPDLILLDMHLPNVSGLEILSYVRATPRFANTKILAVTGNTLLIADLEDQADLVLIKPFTIGEISTLTARLLSGSKTG